MLSDQNISFDMNVIRHKNQQEILDYFTCYAFFLLE